MLRKGILNPALLELLAYIRHTYPLVVATRSFLFWPRFERAQYANLILESA